MVLIIIIVTNSIAVKKRNESSNKKFKSAPTMEDLRDMHKDKIAEMFCEQERSVSEREQMEANKEDQPNQ